MNLENFDLLKNDPAGKIMNALKGARYER